jgi:predicted CXXCH cytochrome family protein
MKAGHPQDPMPVDTSSDLCARCHSDTRFDWQDWQGSTHYQRGMSCSTCHDPHSASLKITKPLDGSAQYTDASQLCITCHKDVSMDFPYSQHHQRGVSCIDCHVTHTVGNSTDVHAMPNHSFKASIDSCNACHSSQMHNTTTAVGTPRVEAPGLTDAQIKEAGLNPQPSPVSPIGFAILAALIGLAAGMVLAPWLEKWYRRVVNHDEEISHD